jgi:disulfide bond formation protein DsbB
VLDLLTPRRTFIALFLASIVGMGFAFWLQYYLGLAPCPLCMTQRAFVVLVGFTGFIAALHNPGIFGQKLYGGLGLAFAGVGGAVAGRHIYLQNLPEDLVPACGPPLEYMLDTLPFLEVINTILMGDGNCADISWTFLGLTIPEQTLLFFIALGSACIWQMVRKDA